MKTVTVSICTGTTCYLLGGAHLLAFDEVLDPATAEHVKIIGSHCLGMCSSEDNGKAPFAKVDNRLIPDATTNKLLSAVREELGMEVG